MPSRTIISILFLLAGSYLHSLQAQQMGFSNYSVKEGLAQSKTTALLEDRRGNLWIGTQSGGISRFDGNQFETFTTRHGLINNQILSLFEDQSDRLWIGTQEGISLYDGEKFTTLKIEGKGSKAVHAIWQQGNGKMWIGTHTGVYTYDHAGWESSLPANTFRTGQVNCFAEDKNGAVWIGHSEGLLRILGNEIKNYTGKDGLNSVDIKAIQQDSEGDIWIGSFLGGVHIFDGRKFVEQFTESKIHRGFILDIAFDNRGNLWISNQLDGLARYDFKSQEINYFNTTVGLPHKHIVDIMPDSWGNVWVASQGGGISKYSKRKFMHFGREHGLPAPNILSIAADSAQNIWMGTSDQGLAVFDGTSFRPFNSQNLFKNIRVPAIHKDRQHRMWLGTDGRGLALFQDTAFHFFPSNDTFRTHFIRAIEEDAQGDLWIASKYHGIYQITPFEDSSGLHLQTRHFNKDSGLISNHIETLHFDTQGRLWYGTADQGIGFLEKEGRIGKMDTTLLEGKHITAFSEDNKGYLWVGTANQGLHHVYLLNKDFHSQSHKGALSSDGIKFLLFDQKEQLWVGTETGLDQVQLDFERKFTEIHHFGREEGLLDIEMNQNAAYLSPNGSLYVGANSGFSMYQTNQTQQTGVQPRIYLNQVNLFYEPLKEYPKYKYLVGSWGQIKQKMYFEADDNHLIFEFNGVDLSQNGSLKYQYRMNGLEKKWSPPSTKTDASYPNLPAGNYTFQVKAINSEGIESEILEVPLAIAIPIYQKTEFIVGAIAAFALLLWILFKIRINQVKAIARVDQEKLKIEKDLVQLEQKALRLQMNPHFLFNALNSIQGLIAREDSKNARYYLAKFSKLMRLVLENSREGMIPLADEIETLEHYLMVEQFSSGGKFSYEIQVDEKLDGEEVLIPPMMIQPFIENAIIHGVAHLSSAGKILVEFRKIAQRIECYVSDNGVGRQKAAEIKSQQAHQHKSTALLVTQERLDILSKGADWGKSIEIVDLKDAEGKPSGTKVIIRLPLVWDA